jgi:hypothetical protein
MPMNAERFKECVLVYGADVYRWPGELRQAGLEALERSVECRTLHEEYSRFEQVLGSPPYEEPSPDLAARIIAAARRHERKALPTLSELLAGLFADLRLPQPALTVVAALIIGFTIGFLLPAGPSIADPEQTDARAFLDSGGEVL